VKGTTVKIENISKKFDKVEVLKNVSLEIKKGEFFSLLGPSGCGKTTLLRIIAGFEYPNTGTVFLDDTNITNLPPEKRPVNTIFQNYALFPHLTVFENVAFSLRLKKKSEAEIQKIVFEKLELARLEDHSKKYPNQLSGGQKQRVAIARALVNEPNVLLLDEPLSALDAKLRQRMLIELDTIHDKIGITFVFVTHDQQEALSVSDRIAVMHEGDILQIGTPSEIYESPKNSFVADFIGETNFIEGKITELDGNYCCMNSEFGKIWIYKDKSEMQVGSKIKLTIRPEKIRITKTIPAMTTDKINILTGKVDELIYTGFLTKFFVEIEDGVLMKVFKQHVKYFLDETPIQWKDDVYIWWNPDDSYVVDVLDEN
jgi:spermidine/putrescine transport system ATP-binding protein